MGTAHQKHNDRQLTFINDTAKYCDPAIAIKPIQISSDGRTNQAEGLVQA